MDLISISGLKQGQEGKVVRVSTTGMIRRRLYDMGLTAGANVRFIKKAPLGDPIEITVRGYNLTLRKSEAETVLVSVTE